MQRHTCKSYTHREVLAGKAVHQCVRQQREQGGEEDQDLQGRGFLHGTSVVEHL